MSHEPETINPYVESLNYLVLIAQDYINTLPASSKLAVTKQASEALETLKRLIEGVPALEQALQDALAGKSKPAPVEAPNE